MKQGMGYLYTKWQPSELSGQARKRSADGAYSFLTLWIPFLPSNKETGLARRNGGGKEPAPLWTGWKIRSPSCSNCLVCCLRYGTRRVGQVTEAGAIATASFRATSYSLRPNARERTTSS